MSNDFPDLDNVVRVIFALYSTLSFNPPPRKFTVLAAFVLFEITTSNIKVISLGTGSKCLPGVHLRNEGDRLHDFHAEIIARRGATRWFMEEASRACRSGPAGSLWLQRLASGKFTLKNGVQCLLYVSTVPCKSVSLSSSLPPSSLPLRW